MPGYNTSKETRERTKVTTQLEAHNIQGGEEPP
jgi:hypothetical protein